MHSGVFTDLQTIRTSAEAVALVYLQDEAVPHVVLPSSRWSVTATNRTVETVIVTTHGNEGATARPSWGAFQPSDPQCHL